MHILSTEEADLVSGGGVVADSVSVGAGAGGAIGFIAFNTVAGAARGGAVGATLELAWEVSLAIGSAPYCRFEPIYYR